MKTAVTLAIVLIALLTMACSDKDADMQTYSEGCWRISLARHPDTLYTLRLDMRETCVDSLTLPWPVYRFDCGDITGDGIPEVSIGVVKPTRYHPTPARRLFIFHLFDGRYLRPLWLGSRVGRPLRDFHVCRDSVPACIHTVESASDHTDIRCEYFWRGFGLQFRRYLSP